MDSRDAHLEDTREPPDTVEYSEVVKAFIEEREDEIDLVLAELALLDYLARRAGLERDFADAASRIRDLIRHVYPTFGYGNMLVQVRKLNQRERQSL